MPKITLEAESQARKEFLDRHRTSGSSRSSWSKRRTRGTGSNGAPGLPGLPGAPGPAGPPGPGFNRDIGESLIFDFPDESYNIQDTQNSLASVTIIPFVMASDGECFEGDPVITTEDPYNDFTLPSFTIDDPAFGTYHVGFQLTVALKPNTNGQISEIQSQLRVDITASRNNSKTTSLENDQTLSGESIP